MIEKKLRLLLLMTNVLVIVSPVAIADIFLTSENLNSALKQIQRSQLQLQNNDNKESALYNLGKTADDLAILLTDEVEAHGAENELLIELALGRTEKLQVDISWAGRNSRFFYDGRALNEYLALYPDGQYRMDSLYRVITREFFLAVPETEIEMLAAIEKKESFIHQYPDFARLSEIELYLAIDYRDLWRHYRNNQADDYASQAADKTTQQLQRIVDKYQDKDEGEIARRLLDRFLAQITNVENG